MCTICGLVVAEADPRGPSLVLEMLERTRYRGPDSCGIHADGRVVYAEDADRLASKVPESFRESRILLGQSRLRITGSRAGRQPFVSRDGRLALAHNGEVYNHAELATLLENPGGAATGSDSEVLLRVLEHHVATTNGDLPEAMRRTVGVASGMYALAATNGHDVVLARDAIGKKPLYFVDAESTFAFASERKALATVAQEQRVPIQRVLPGQMVVRGPHRPLERETVERLASPAIHINRLESAVDLYEAALERAIQRRTHGLPQAAVLFSGGVDSVLVARLLQRAGVDVTGYVAGVDGSADIRYAVEAAQALDLPVTVTKVTEEDLAADLPGILRAAELNGPVQAETSIPMWYASRAAHEDGHRVIFTGQAADELFAGYDWYREVYEEQGPLTLHARMWEDLRALPLDTLEREDRITMAWSLELRAPFLDADVIRTAMSMAPSLKIRSGQDPDRKHPHRLLALRLGVPRAVAYRPKATAQDGSNVHELLKRIARGRKKAVAGPDEPLVDFGSNYRYRDEPGQYTTPQVYALLAQIVRDHGLLVASAQDGSAHPPAAPWRGTNGPTRREEASSLIP